MTKIYLALLVCFSLLGCLTSQKATSYLLSKNELAGICQNYYPCTTKKTDSVRFITDTKYADSILLEYEKAAYSNDSLLRILGENTGNDVCDSINSQILDFAQKKQVENNNLLDQILKLKNIIHSFHPIEKSVIDSSLNQSFRDQINRINSSNMILLENYNKQVADYKGMKEKRKFWMIFALVELGLIIAFFIGVIMSKKK